MARTKTDGPAPRRTLRWRVLIAAALCTAAAGGLVVYQTVSSAATDRPVTMDEASRLALSRLNLYQASPVAVTLTAAEGGGVTIRVQGVVDYRSHRAVGSYQVTGTGGAKGQQLDHGLMVWDADGLGLAPTPQDATGPAWQQAEHVPRAGWSPRAYTTDPLDSGLQLLIQLGADRPDNPMLLAQSGARWLGRDRIDGRGYDRIAGPRSTGDQSQGQGQAASPGTGLSPLTYWVDGDGGLRRVTMRMPGLGTPTVLDLTGKAAGATLPDAPWAAG